MAVWMCADMLTVLLHQLLGKGEVIATPASCFQRGVLCVYPQATIKACSEPRFNHMHHSCPTETHCSKPETHWYQKSCPKLYGLMTKAWESLWPDCDPCNYPLYWDCQSSSSLRLLWKELSCELGACGDRLINRMVGTYPRKVSNERRRFGWTLLVILCSASQACALSHLWLFCN